MKGETQEPNKGFANTRPPAQPTQEKLSRVTLVFRPALRLKKQTINIPLSIGVQRGRSDHRDFPLDDIDFRKHGGK